MPNPALTIECPKCGAKPLDRCKGPLGPTRARGIHQDRIVKAAYERGLTDGRAAALADFAEQIVGVKPDDVHPDERLSLWWHEIRAALIGAEAPS